LEELIGVWYDVNKQRNGLKLLQSRKLLKEDDIKENEVYMLVFNTIE